MRKFLYSILLVCAFNTTALANTAKDNFEVPCFFQQHTYTDSSLILIPFDYKQSALYHSFTFEVIDSVVNILLKDTAITLSIIGYAHQDEGSDTICKYLSLNRALFIKDYVLGRGVNHNRIILVQGMGKIKSKNNDVNKDGHKINCKAELHLNFPPPPKPKVMEDRDEDGVADAEDNCPDKFGYKENGGCPDSNAVVIPFESQQSFLSGGSYKVLDSVLIVLKENPAFNITIQGHAYKEEGINNVCERLATQRADIVKNYLLSRNISGSRIIKVAGMGNTKPLNAGKNPLEILRNSRAEIFFNK